MQTGLNSFTLTPKQWIEKTAAIGLVSQAGRYGGTYAHKDIAFEFASWISVEFKLYLIREFQRLKEDENRRLSLAWNLNRTLSKLNYRIHTDAIKAHLIPPEVTPAQAAITYATEADLLNVALFGHTAKQWRDANPTLDGTLINNYIPADAAVDLGDLNSLSLTELIIETGIHDAIARKLNEKGKLSKNAIAEGIINNVRKTIVRDQLTDPRFYAEMSKLLEDLIAQSRADTAAYEAFLKKAEDLVKRLAKKLHTEGVPAALHGKPEAIVIFNNLSLILTGEMSWEVADEDPADTEKRISLVLEIDLTMREKAPSGWKEDIDGPRGKQVLNALFPMMNQDRRATLALFDLIKNQPGY
jgi:hypothetical protein